MADSSRPNRKPRVRKTAPTVREKAQAAQSKVGSAKPKKFRRLARATTKPFRVVKIPSNPVTRFLGRIGRIIGKVLGWLVPRYFVNSWREVRLVTWPGRKETWRLTLAVVIFAIVFGAMVAGVDKVIDILFRKLVLK
ncbi:preprotein translocase subunit SecE [Candidatus Saccharibacteria bacterium CG10_big_fil_rev_8_21_14_0_10_47_8]|nr:MAG: preprotein translocase subunit SecE [Candidatus Saccharibacteria bacterium CG10_big_fil_rev_8_21_14_0_10_47_8]